MTSKVKIEKLKIIKFSFKNINCFKTFKIMQTIIIYINLNSRTHKK